MRLVECSVDLASPNHFITLEIIIFNWSLHNKMYKSSQVGNSKRELKLIDYKYIVFSTDLGENERELYV